MSLTGVPIVEAVFYKLLKMERLTHLKHNLSYKIIKDFIIKL